MASILLDTVTVIADPSPRTCVMQTSRTTRFRHRARAWHSRRPELDLSVGLGGREMTWNLWWCTASPYPSRIRWNLQSASWPTLALRTPASRPCVTCRASSLTQSGTSRPWLLSNIEPSVRRPCVLTLRDFSLHLHRRHTLQCNVTISPLFAIVEHSEGVCSTGSGVCQRVR